MGTKVVVKVEELRGVASSLRSAAVTIENKGNDLSVKGSVLETVSTSALSALSTEVQSLRDHSTALDARVDLAILYNTGDSGNVPQTGTLAYEVAGEDTTNPVAVQQQLGTAIGEFGEKIGSEDYKENDPRIQVLNSYMKTWFGNQTVMGSMYDRLGEEGTLALITSVGDHVGIRNRSSQEQAELAKSTLQLLKGGLATATNGWPDAKAEKFGKGLVDAAVNGIPHDSPYSDKFGMTSMAEALAFIAYNNPAASASFMYGAAIQADVRERERVDQGLPSPFNWMTPSRFLPALVAEGDIEWALDAPTSLMRALSAHPEKAYKFFHEDEQRADYWVTKRDYDDDFTAIARALDSASTNWAVRRDDPEGAAAIAALAINGLGGRDDFGFVDNPWPVSDSTEGVGASSSLARILETYIQGMNYSIFDNENTADLREVSEGHDSNNNPLGVMPRFNVDRLSEVLNVVGRDGGAFLKLRGAQNSYQEQLIQSGMTQEEFKDASQRLAKTEGFVAGSIGTGQIKDAQAHDAYVKAWIELAGVPASKLSGLASKYAGPAAPAAGWASDKMIEELKTQAEKKWANETAGTTADMEKQANIAMQQYTRSLLFSADADGLNGYQNGVVSLNSSNESAVQNPDGTYRLMTRSEYDDLVKQAETDDAAAKKLEAVNDDLLEIAGNNAGYLPTSSTRGDIEEAFKNPFVKYY